MTEPLDVAPRICLAPTLGSAEILNQEARRFAEGAIP